MIRIHKETYEDLARYAYETGFYNALQDYLEECGLPIKIKSVRLCNYHLEKNDEAVETYDINWEYSGEGIVDFGDRLVIVRIGGGPKDLKMPLKNCFYQSESSPEKLVEL